MNSAEALTRSVLINLRSKLFASPTLTSVNFRGELNYVDQVSSQKIKCGPIRARKFKISKCNFNYMLVCVLQQTVCKNELSAVTNRLR